MIVTYAADNAKKLSKVHPHVARLASLFIERCAGVGVDIKITHGLRTFAEQADLYAKGRLTAGKIVTNAGAGYSYHNYGLAIDFVPINKKGQAVWSSVDERWDIAIGIAEEAGFQSGSKFTTLKDLPHLQYTLGYKVAELLKIYNEGDHRLSAVWTAIDQRIKERENIV